MNTLDKNSNDPVSLNDEQMPVKVTADRFSIGTEKELDREKIGSEPVLVSNTIHDDPSKLFGNFFDLETITLVSSTSLATTEKNYWNLIWGYLSPIFNQRWKYFKCDMELTFEIVSSALDYGFFSIGWNPSSITGTPYATWNSNPHIMDISTGGTHLITVPYSSIYEGYDVNGLIGTSAEVPNIPKVYYTQGGMGTLAATFSAVVKVRGRFVNMVTWGVGLIDNDLPVTFEEIVEESPVPIYEHQMSNTGVPVSVLGLGAASGVLATGYQVFTQVKNGEGPFENKSLYRDVNREVEDLEDAIEAETINDTTPTIPTPFPSMTQMQYVPRNENFSFSMRRVAPRHLYDRKPKKLREIAQIPCIIFSRDLVANSAFNLYVTPMPTFNPTQKNDPPDYLAQVADLFRFWRGSIDYTMSFHTSPLITAQLIFECAQFGSINPETSTATWSKNFTYRKTVNITGHSLVNIRVPFVFNAAWAPLEGKFLNVPNNYLVPLCPSILRVTVLNITSGLAGSGATPHIYVAIERSGGSDIQFRNFTGVSYNPRGFVPPLSEVEHQMHCVNQKPVEGWDNICKGSVYAQPYRYTVEDDLTTETASRRWSNFQFTTSGSLFPASIDQIYGDNSFAPSLFYRLMSWYRYVRGNVAFRVSVDQTEVSPDIIDFSMDRDDTYSNFATNPFGTECTAAGQQKIVTEFNPIAEFEAPIEGETEWLLTLNADTVSETNNMLSFSLKTEDVPSTLYQGFVRSGRAYSLGYLQPPFRQYNYLARCWGFTGPPP